MKKRVSIIVKGLVQGVGYRHFCYRRALQYGITGYAKNLVNGEVQVEAVGEEGMLNDFIKELKIGPFGAKVNSVKVEELSFENKYDEFNIY